LERNVPVKLTIEQLKSVEDLELPVGEWFSISQERINGFAETTEDRQWIHLDQERAAASPFGGTIAHGYLLLALLPKLLFDVVEFSDAKMVVNYGLDKLRFIHPVPSGSEVRLRARISRCTERGNGLMVRIRGGLELKDNGRKAVVTDLLMLLRG
jgi:acyl dehydratase